MEKCGTQNDLQAEIIVKFAFLTLNLCCTFFRLLLRIAILRTFFFSVVQSFRPYVASLQQSRLQHSKGHCSKFVSYESGGNKQQKKIDSKTTEVLTMEGIWKFECACMCVCVRVMRCPHVNFDTVNL